MTCPWGNLRQVAVVLGEADGAGAIVGNDAVGLQVAFLVCHVFHLHAALRVELIGVFAYVVQLFL